MKFILYGTRLCKDCICAVRVFEERKIGYEYREFSEDISYIKEFLKVRDNSEAFKEMREVGGIGVPCFVFEDGFVTLELEEALEKCGR